jgi:hypothetical protein
MPTTVDQSGLLEWLRRRRLDTNFYLSIGVNSVWTDVCSSEPYIQLWFTENISRNWFEKVKMLYSVIEDLASELNIGFLDLLLYNMKEHVAVRLKAFWLNVDLTAGAPSYTWWKSHDDMSSLTRQVRAEFDFAEVALEYYEFWSKRQSECILEQSPYVFRLVAVDCFTPSSIVDLHLFEKAMSHKLETTGYVNLPLQNATNAYFFGGPLDFLRGTKQRWDPQNRFRGGRNLYMP